MLYKNTNKYNTTQMFCIGQNVLYTCGLHPEATLQSPLLSRPTPSRGMLHTHVNVVYEQYNIILLGVHYTRDTTEVFMYFFFFHIASQLQ